MESRSAPTTNAERDAGHGGQWVALGAVGRGDSAAKRS